MTQEPKVVFEPPNPLFGIGVVYIKSWFVYIPVINYVVFTIIYVFLYGNCGVVILYISKQILCGSLGVACLPTHATVYPLPL